MATCDRRGDGWTVDLRRQPSLIVDGHPRDGYRSAFEFICCDRGDNPGLDYRQVQLELQRIREACPIAAGVAAYDRRIAQRQGRQAGRRA